MSEFSQKDYGTSRDLANNVKDSAENIMSIFEKIDNTMKKLYGESWQSSGADLSSDRYNEIRKNYELFYQNVINMHEHVNSATTDNENADAKVSQELSDLKG